MFQRILSFAAMFAVFCALGSASAQNGAEDVIVVTGTLPIAQPTERGLKAFDRAQDAIESENYRKALSESVKACDGNVPSGCFNAMKIAGSDEYGQQDVSLALRVSKQGCDLGVYEGCASIGASLKYGLMGVEPDQTEAEAYLTRACDGGFGIPDACFEVASTILSDSNRLSDYPKAYETLQEACEEDDAENSRSCLMFATLLEHGIGGPQDLNEAMDTYKYRCDLGSAFACFRGAIVDSQTKKQSESERKLLADKGCELGEGAACALRITFGVGLWGDTGRDGWKVYEDEVEEVWAAAVKGCELGHPHACFAKGAMLHLGDRGTPDLAQAKANFEIACEADHYEACIILMNYEQLGVGAAADPGAADMLKDKVCFGVMISSYCDVISIVGSAVLLDPRYSQALKQIEVNEKLSEACQGGNLNACFITMSFADTDEERESILVGAIEIASEACDPAVSFDFICQLILTMDEYQYEDLGTPSPIREKIEALAETYPIHIKKKCDAGDYTACINYISFLDRVEEDVETAANEAEYSERTQSLLLEACAQKDAFACFMGLKANGFHLRFSTDTDAKKLEYWEALQTACLEGIVVACSEYADAVYNGTYSPADKPYGIELYETNCRAGFSSDCEK